MSDWLGCNGRKRFSASSDSRSGIVLIIVLIAMMLLALSAYTFSNQMLEHRKVTVAMKMRAQSDASVASAVDATRAFLMQPPDIRDSLGGVYDNPQYFNFQPVVDDPTPQFRSRFSIMSTELGDSNQESYVRFGLMDESSKINLNELVANEDPEELSLTTLTLLVLPGMTVEIADAILDWIDADVERREYGAEFAEDYSGMEPPRAPADGPIHSLSELLMVRGVTAEMLYGMDQNRNGIVEPNEEQLASNMQGLTGQAGEEGEETVTASMELGWSAYLTLYSREHNLNPEGQYRINLNQPDLELLYEELLAANVDADTATFICAYRQTEGAYKFEGEEEEEEENEEEAGAGGQQGGPGGAPEENEEEEEEEEEVELIDGREIDLTAGAEYEFESIADLYNAVIEVTFDGEEDSVLVISPLTTADPDSLDPPFLEYVSVTDERATPGRININQAARPVLATLRDLPNEAIEQILATRQDRNTGANGSYGRANPIWLLANEIVDGETMRAIMPLITRGGDVYSADIVASTGDGNAVRRVRVVLDATRPEVPQLVWKDKDFLGRGFPREMLMDSDAQTNFTTP